MSEGPVDRAREVAAEIREQIARMIVKAAEVLRLPVPDTFLGRETHGRFPTREAE